jgi:hypothetical protein
MQSKATTVEQYLAELPPDRRAAIQAVREVILRNLDPGFREGMAYGAIGYCVPHSRYPAGYHCDPKQPLPFAGLGNQKHHMSLGLMSVYGPDSDEAWLRDAWAATGKKLDMGKVCIRFKRVEDLPLEVIGEAVRRMPVDRWIEHYERSILTMNKAKAARASAAKGAAPARPGRSTPKPASEARTDRAGTSAKASRAAPKGAKVAPQGPRRKKTAARR